MMTPKQLTVELDARLDGPHTDEHTAAVADLADECIRFLNYATGSHSPAALVYPSTVYRLAGNLTSASYRMVQLFDQLADWLAAEDAAGMLAVDDGTPASEVVAAARQELAEATGHTKRLSARLAALQNAISGLNGYGPNRAERAA
jgi:hypothetical protein